MLKSKFKKHTLEFKHPSGTSRGVLKIKETWFLIIWNAENPNIKGIGECGLLKTLSYDERPGYEEKLQEVCDNINNHQDYLISGLKEWPSIHFGLEMALTDLENKGNKKLFPSKFTSGLESIKINGLVWMGEYDFMRSQIIEKIDSGFDCIKLKIGAIDFDQELSLLKQIRSEFSESEIEIRVDANGAFIPGNALHKLNELSKFNLHSIEQPIKQGQLEDMAKLCLEAPFPIALDEELIGVTTIKEKKKVLDTIKPQYIILKPSLVGGFKGSLEWMNLAKQREIKWWITSALESNIGLNAIAQWTYSLNNEMPQGLGTGGLFTNNIDSPLEVEKGHLQYNPTKDWGLGLLND